MSASEILIFSALLLYAIVTGRVEGVIDAFKKVLNIDQLKRAFKEGAIRKGEEGETGEIDKTLPKPPGDPIKPPVIGPLPPCVPGKPCRR